MSNFELNMAITEALGINLPTGEQIKANNFLKRRGDVLFRVGDGGTYETALCLDYCNNWNDLMPLVVEYGISLTPLTKGERIFMYRGYAIDGIRVEDKNPQRALAECLLKVLQGASQ